mmetsp:Transcript_84218/g.225900  ORF Transcript_84218/g.225900 Transcript_84218/m.225900 type:complete len:286 (+) Transcript_84218:235-1092(+)
MQRVIARSTVGVAPGRKRRDKTKPGRAREREEAREGRRTQGGTYSRLRPVLVSVRVLGLPLPRAFAHVLERAFRLPAKVGLGLGGIRDHRGQISRAAVHDLIVDGLARGYLEGLDHVQDGRPGARAQIVDDAAGIHAKDLLQRAYVPFGQVVDVDVVAHACAVCGGPVVPVHRENLSPPHGDLLHKGHEVVRHARRALAYSARGVSAHGVEVPEDGDLQRRVRLRGVEQELLDHVLRPAVGVRAAGGLALIERLLARLVDRGGGGEHYVLAAVVTHRLQDVQGAD